MNVRSLGKEEEQDVHKCAKSDAGSSPWGSDSDGGNVEFLLVFFHTLILRIGSSDCGPSRMFVAACHVDCVGLTWVSGGQ